MNTADFDYILPQEKIAIHAPEVRGSTKLMVLGADTGEITDSKYAKLDEYLEKGDVIVLNDTRVFNARLFGYLPGGKKFEFILLEKHDTIVDLEVTNTKALYKGKIRVGDTLQLDKDGKDMLRVVDLLENGIAEIDFGQPVVDVVKKYGKTPIPPYLKRPSDENDEARYQTAFAKTTGSVAAPTASLNMTSELLKKLEQKGVIVVYITLHVGLGTFLPIRTENLDEHRMHSEFFSISKETISIIRTQKKLENRIIGLGTTVTRALEYNAEKILDPKTKLDLVGDANIFIYPGYEFKIVDGLLTNFHAPRSTVLMLASAFAGTDNLKSAYLYALEHGYKFLSYGDSMLIV